MVDTAEAVGTLDTIDTINTMLKEKRSQLAHT